MEGKEPVGGGRDWSGEWEHTIKELHGPLNVTKLSCKSPIIHISEISFSQFFEHALQGYVAHYLPDG